MGCQQQGFGQHACQAGALGPQVGVERVELDFIIDRRDQPPAGIHTQVVAHGLYQAFGQQLIRAGAREEGLQGLLDQFGQSFFDKFQYVQFHVLSCKAYIIH